MSNASCSSFAVVALHSASHAPSYRSPSTFPSPSTSFTPLSLAWLCEAVTTTPLARVLFRDDFEENAATHAAMNPHRNAMGSIAVSSHRNPAVPYGIHVFFFFVWFASSSFSFPKKLLKAVFFSAQHRRTNSRRASSGMTPTTTTSSREALAFCRCCTSLCDDPISFDDDDDENEKREEMPKNG